MQCFQGLRVSESTHRVNGGILISESDVMT
jgi:hypothetical protein